MLLGAIIVCLMAVTLMALPHLLEGIVHLHAAPWLAALAAVPVGTRDLPDGLGASLHTADGYRSTKSVEAPGFRTGDWRVALDDGSASLRMSVRDARTAVVTVPARARWPFRHIERAMGTIRVRLVDVGQARRLQAHVAPASLCVPLAIPAYAALSAALGGSSILWALEGSFLTTVVVFVLWTALWWAFHGSKLREGAALAMRDLEGHLASAPVATA
jgi:hypothetical protein